MTIKEVSEKFHITQDTLRYYERVGMIPPVTRTAGGMRDYQETDLAWVELAVCMRSAGLPVAQREVLLEQRAQIDDTLNRLDYKISRYEEALKTGKLTWE